MKRIIYIMFIFIITIMFNKNIVYGDEFHTYTKFNNTEMKIETSSGDSYYFETDGNKNYRMKFNNEKCIDITDLESKYIFNINIFESSSYVYVYGSYLNDELNDEESIPYIIRVSKTMEFYDSYIDSESYTKLNHFNSLIEYSEDLIVGTLFYNGEFDFYYKGNYKLISFDNNFKEISSLELGINESRVSVCYDTLEVIDSYNRISYFDRYFNRCDKPLSLSEITGYLELDENMNVNGKDCSIGDIFTEPGYYTLDDYEHEKIKILLKPTFDITGEINKDNKYTSKVSYKISGGKLYINGEESYLNGTIEEPGNYSLLIIGIDDYMISKNITILPKLLTDINNNPSVGDSLNFTGSGYLNGEKISSGYKIEEAGNYIFKLILDNEEIYSYSFVVSDANDNATILDVSTNDSNNNSNLIFYILYGIIGILVIILIINLIKWIRNRIINKRIFDEEKS